MTLHEIGQHMIPAVTGSAIVEPAVFRIAQLPGGGMGRIALASRACNRLENSPVRSIAGQLIFDSLVFLESGPGIQLGEKGKEAQCDQGWISQRMLANQGGDGEDRNHFGDGDGMQQFSR